jgi:hypothetical protein
LRWECLDYMILFTENHLRQVLHTWVPHYNASCPHMALGPGMPQPPASLPAPLQTHRHQLPPHRRVVARPVLSSLHHAYGLEAKAA